MHFQNELFYFSTGWLIKAKRQNMLLTIHTAISKNFCSFFLKKSIAKSRLTIVKKDSTIIKNIAFHLT